MSFLKRESLANIGNKTGLWGGKECKRIAYREEKIATVGGPEGRRGVPLERSLEQSRHLTFVLWWAGGKFCTICLGHTAYMTWSQVLDRAKHLFCSFEGDGLQDHSTAQPYNSVQRGMADLGDMTRSCKESLQSNNRHWHLEAGICDGCHRF